MRTVRIKFVRSEGMTDETVREIMGILGDERGWAGQNVRFDSVDGDDHELRVEMRSAAEIGDEFGPGFARLSLCSSDGFIYLNRENWENPPADFDHEGEGTDRTRRYREYVTQHEFGHWLGLWSHAAPVSATAPCPVMYQQTKGTRGRCLPNPWQVDDPTHPMIEGGGAGPQNYEAWLEKSFLDASGASPPDESFIRRMLDPKPFSTEEDAMTESEAHADAHLQRTSNSDLRRALWRVMRLMVHYRGAAEEAAAADEAAAEEAAAKEAAAADLTDATVRRLKGLLDASERELGMATGALERQAAEAAEAAEAAPGNRGGREAAEAARRVVAGGGSPMMSFS